MVDKNLFTGTCNTWGEIDLRSSDHIDRGRHQSLHPMRIYGAHGESITLIFAKKIVALTILKVTGVRAQEMCAKEVGAEEVWATKQTSMYVTVKEVTSIVSASQMMAMTIGATPGQHLPSDITTVITLTMQTLHRTTTSSTAPLQPSWPRSMLVSNSTRRQ
jgi:hypothetical protein